MTVTLVARWCCGEAVGMGTAAALTDEVRSALDRSDSDQLNPSPERRERELVLLPKGSLLLPYDDDKPRPLAVGGQAKVTEALPAVFPFPALTSRNALAPKLIRRAKGVVGVDKGVTSPSSTALSSMPGEPDPELE